MRQSSGVQKILTRQPPVQVDMVAGGSSLHHIRDETAMSVFYTPDDGRMTPETCTESLQ